jgi:hypothetical protein
MHFKRIEDGSMNPDASQPTPDNNGDIKIGLIAVRSELPNMNGKFH